MSARRHVWPVLGLGAIVALTFAPSSDNTATAARPSIVDPLVGSQGTDTALPATDSQVTVNGRDAFSTLAVTVNQTTNLTNQTVSLTWTGAAPTVTSPGTFSGNFLQIMQCWGEDDGTNVANPGPAPEQCVFGGVGSISAPPASIYPDGNAVGRVIGVVGWPGLDLTDGVVDMNDGQVWRPFRSVTGETVPFQTNSRFSPGTNQGGNYWLNSFFNATTTNEIAGGRTYADGKGAELFEVHTGQQSSGLGCGQSVQPVAGGGTKIPKCWLVIVPRGTAAAENAGTPFAGFGASTPVVTSPMRASVWQHRIAIPLEFQPLDASCVAGQQERRIAGSDLIQPAVSSWQPVLCASGTLPPYSYVSVGDAAARQQLAQSVEGGPGMVVVSKPFEDTQLDPESPVVYVPVGVSGLTIGFNVERNTKSGNIDEAALSGMRVAQMNLTPRLVAKLLAQSYLQQVAITGTLPPTYTWAANNPLSMMTDPDFLQFNPEFTLLLSSDDRSFGGLQLPSATSDAAQQLWRWVFADPEAKAWLNGTPDAWGMRVNPMYSTDASLNPTHTAFDTPVPQSFPKADPYCFQGAPRGPNNSIIPPPLCGTDWMPYARNYRDTARIARAAFDAAKINENSLALSSSGVWSKGQPQFIGRKMMLSLTDTASAFQFGVQTAHLSRAGDDGAGRQFIAPDTAGLLAGVTAMQPGADPSVLEPAPGTLTDGAYPLTMLSYAAVKPLSLDTTARANYAAFLTYAVGPGQVVGVQAGQLPRGYAPLPSALKAQSDAAIAQVLSMPPVPTTTVTTQSEPPVTTRRTSSGGGGTTAEPPPVTEETTPVEVSTTTTTSSAPTTTTTIAAVPTPSVNVGGGRYTVVGLGIAALGSAMGALEISKRPRRARSAADILIDHEVPEL